MDGQLRPLGIGEILDAGIKLFMRHWRTLVLSVVGLVLPVQIVSALITASVAPEQFDWTTTETRRRGGRGGRVPRRPGRRSLLLTFVSVLLATAVCFKAVADAYLGGEPDWRRSLRFAVRRLGGLFGLSILGGVLVLLGLLALIVPGIWLAVAFAVGRAGAAARADRPVGGAAALVPARARALVADRGRAARRLPADRRSSARCCRA